MGARWADRALTATAALGALAVVAALACAVLGLRPFLIRSGSMEPALAVGGAALAREVDAGEVRVGDIVAVRAEDGAWVAHRVRSAAPVADPAGAGTVELRLRGDANETDDPAPYRVQRAYLVLGAVPLAGYALAWLGSPAGIAVVGLMLALVALAAMGARHRSRGRGDPSGGPAGGGPGRHRAPRRRGGMRATTIAVGLACSALAAGTWGAPPARAAFWTDDAAITGSGYTATTVSAPTLSCGGLGLLSVTFTWTSVPGATSYTLHYGSSASNTLTTTSTSHTFLSAISGGSAWVEANRDFGSVTWKSGPSNTRSYTVAVISLCS